MSKIQDAYIFAKEKHGGQKYNNQDFIVHPLMTSKILSLLCGIEDYDENLIVAGLLHDVVEDTDTTLEAIEHEFGEDVANLVYQVTKTGHNTFPISTHRGAVLKFADRLTNVYNSKNWPKEKMEKYVFEKSKFWK